MKHYLVGLLTAMFALTGVGAAHADHMVCCGDQPVKWTTSGADVSIKLITSMQGDIGEQPFRDAAAAWSNLAGSGFDLAVVNDDDNSLTEGGDGNEVGFFTSIPSGVAVTVTTYTQCETCDSWTCGGSSCTPGHLVETDIYFRVNSYDFGDPGTWTSDTGDLYSTWNFRMIAAHEIGHVVGLDENSGTGLSRMESHIVPGGWFAWQVPGATRVTALGPDVSEVAGMYPEAGGSSDLYSINMQHRATADPNNNVNSVPLSWEGSDTTYYPRSRTWRGTDWRHARAGDIVDVRVCYGNLGPPWGSDTTLKFVFSTDTTPTTSDAVTPDGWYYPGGVGGPGSWCETLGITVPSVAVGEYYVIFGINGVPSGASNNWQVVNRKVHVIN